MKNLLPYLTVFRSVDYFQRKHFSLIIFFFLGSLLASLTAQKPLVTCVVGNCEIAVKDTITKLCSGHIELTAEAKDDSTADDQLLWSYKIDLYNDGSGIYSGYDLQISEISKAQYKLGLFPVTRDNRNADDATQSFDASGIYPIGIHKLCWFVKDAGGNIGTCCTLFEIKDCKAPTPYCQTGIISIAMPISGCVDILAKDLNLGSLDNCSSKENLKFYFDGDPNKPSIRICCDDFAKGRVSSELRVDLEMWVEDEEGNRDFCKTIIVVTDNLKICPPPEIDFGKISGQIKTRDKEVTGPVKVQLYEKEILLEETIGGPYAFNDLSIDKTYTVKLNRNDDHLNGVSTLDVTLIQKHILGKSPFTNPYVLIAADVTNSKSITAADISEMRKLILGTISEFTKVQSWTFVAERKKFADTTSPWNNSVLDSFSLDTINLVQNNSQRTLNFIAIKMGDVSANARARTVQTRNKETLEFTLNDRNIEIDKEYKIDFTSSNFKNIEGFQFTLNFDQTALEFTGKESGVLNLQDENFGLNRLEQGIITTSWNSDSELNADNSQVLFSINFRSKKSGYLSDLIQLNSIITKAEAYSNLDELMDLKLKFQSDQTKHKTELLDNLPNPFSESTSIRFYLNEEAFVNIRLFAVTGQVLKEYTVSGKKGINAIEIKKQDLNSSGIILYQMESNNYSATKRMLITE
ncbi:MAG: T9SS type A sorting domain-containing protein [Saprospiraceae bacterium]